MKIKVLHIVGGSSTNGAYKGASILHQALLELNIDSKLALIFLVLGLQNISESK